MIKFKQLFNFPSVFSKRNKEIPQLVRIVKIQDVNKDEKNKTVTITSSVHKHTSQITFFDVVIPMDINSDKEVTVQCSCESFKFEFAFALEQKKSLMNSKSFILNQPKKKNTFNSISGCKHLIALANYIKINKIM